MEEIWTIISLDTVDIFSFASKHGIFLYYLKGNVNFKIYENSGCELCGDVLKGKLSYYKVHSIIEWSIMRCLCQNLC